MESLATAEPVDQLAPDRFALERRLRTAERHYAEARGSADRARDEWRALSVHPRATASAIQAARAKFEMVAERCKRLMAVIEDLEDRLD